jgi:D-alanyl-D-alanine carboxypeptidase
VNSTEFSFGETEEAQWLAEHCAEYGFIIRFPEGKEDITGYSYEPWHIRYVGVEAAQAITSSGLCLEEYLGVTSDYADSPDCEEFAAKYGDSQSDN